MFVEVVSPEESCFTGDATMVISRTPNGEIGILEGHEKTVATLMPGGLTIEHDNTRTSFAISGGILQVTSDKVVVLGEIVEKVDGDHEKAIEIGQELGKKAFPEE